MKVEVAYAKPEEQMILDVDVLKDATVLDAIKQSGVLERFGEIDINSCKVGIFSKHASLNTTLQPGDRVEIYRPLIIDPKTARLLRAEKKASE